MLSQLSRPLSKTTSIRRATQIHMIRPQKRTIILSPVRAQPIVIDLLLGSIALYLMVDVGSVFYKKYKEKEDKKD